MVLNRAMHHNFSLPFPCGVTRMLSVRSHHPIGNTSVEFLSKNLTWPVPSNTNIFNRPNISAIVPTRKSSPSKASTFCGTRNNPGLFFYNKKQMTIPTDIQSVFYGRCHLTEMG